MRKIIVFNLVSLDGYFAGPNGEIDWHNVDDEFNQFAVEQTQKFGAILFGRTTYQLFEDFWPALLASQPASLAQLGGQGERVAGRPKAGVKLSISKEDLKIAKIINDIDKIVFSTTLKKVTWNNSSLFHEINPEEIKKLKEADGKDIVIFGSGTIVQQMTNLGLVDEYRLLVNPIILGKGKPMFANMKDMLKLKLLKIRTFGNGNILLYYSPKI